METPWPSRARSAALFERACGVLVGGVNSPVRAFRAVGGEPLFMARGEGAYLYDADGNRSIDLVGSWGPAIAGHAHPHVVAAVREAAGRGLSFGASCEAEIELAERIVSAVPGCEMVRLVCSGTEAVMSAVRLARAATGRSLIVKFAGCYHGHADALLVEAGSGMATFGVSASAGVPAGAVADTLVARFNDLRAVETIFRAHGRRIAGVLVEPVAGNMGMVMPRDGFLSGLRRLCDEHGSLLIFDEVMTGFRVAYGGCQELGLVRADLTCLGKVIGGGLPVGAYAGPRRLMEMVSPLGPVYQAGTLSGNPVAMAAGLATLDLCRAEGFYETLYDRASRLARGLRRLGEEVGVPVRTVALGGMLGLFFSEREVSDLDGARACDHERFASFFRGMLERGVFLPPSPYEAMFVSAAHSREDVERVLEAADKSLRRSGGRGPG